MNFTLQYFYVVRQHLSNFQSQICQLIQVCVHKKHRDWTSHDIILKLILSLTQYFKIHYSRVHCFENVRSRFKFPSTLITTLFVFFAQTKKCHSSRTSDCFFVAASLHTIPINYWIHVCHKFDFIINVAFFKISNFSFRFLFHWHSAIEISCAKFSKTISSIFQSLRLRWQNYTRIIAQNRILVADSGFNTHSQIEILSMRKFCCHRPVHNSSSHSSSIISPWSQFSNQNHSFNLIIFFFQLQLSISKSTKNYDCIIHFQFFLFPKQF